MDRSNLPPNCEIRPLRAGDAAAWRELRLQALKDEPMSFAASYEEALARDPAWFAEVIPGEDDPSAIFGLFVGGALEGVAGFVVQSGAKHRHKGLLWSVYVRPGWRGKGLAKALVARVIERARAHVSLLQVSVAAINQPARRVYIGLGFVPYGVEVAGLRVDGVDIDEELMWIDFRGLGARAVRSGADSLPAAGLSDRRAP
jgi:ribosomal protein S18 acetylase RimI-like enzyme